MQERREKPMQTFWKMQIMYTLFVVKVRLGAKNNLAINSVNFQVL
jgi:hypothetical protein